MHFSELQLGEVSRSENFHLGDAMSAIELMDPKMDCGMVPIKKTLGLEKSIEVTMLGLARIILTNFRPESSMSRTWTIRNSLQPWTPRLQCWHPGCKDNL